MARFVRIRTSRAAISTSRRCWNSHNPLSGRELLQPIIVRRTASGGFEIIAGERRWRAASLAGLKEVPVILREADDQKVLELAIVENIQREDLNPIELAVAFERMATELSLSHEEIGQKTGKDRATVTNSIRLLQLPVPVQEFVSSPKTHSGARPGAAEAYQRERLRSIWRRSVFMRVGRCGKSKSLQSLPTEPGDEIVARKAAAKTAGSRICGQLLGTGTSPWDPRQNYGKIAKAKGSIELEYYSDEDLDRIYTLIVGTDETIRLCCKAEKAQQRPTLHTADQVFPTPASGFREAGRARID